VPPAPEPPEPEFFAADARTGAMPIQIYIDGQARGKAYLFPHPTTPNLSLQAFNHLFGRSVYWVPADGATVRLFTGGRSLLTRDFTIVQGRLWLQLSPALQESLGVQVSAYSDSLMYFSTK
ncbi:MAG: hypothetical protein JWN15_498, partial [Firmicutes bacterium]|nr:hypothetical protein [Bacillota bacterium]